MALFWWKGWPRRPHFLDPSAVGCERSESLSSSLLSSFGRRPNGFLGLSLNDRTLLFLVILSVPERSLGTEVSKMAIRHGE